MDFQPRKYEDRTALQHRKQSTCDDAFEKLMKEMKEIRTVPSSTEYPHQLPLASARSWPNVTTVEPNWNHLNDHYPPWSHGHEFTGPCYNNPAENWALVGSASPKPLRCTLSAPEHYGNHHYQAAHVARRPRATSARNSPFRGRSPASSPSRFLSPPRPVELEIRRNSDSALDRLGREYSRAWQMSLPGSSGSSCHDWPAMGAMAIHLEPVQGQGSWVDRSEAEEQPRGLDHNYPGGSYVEQQPDEQLMCDTSNCGLQFRVTSPYTSPTVVVTPAEEASTHLMPSAGWHSSPHYMDLTDANCSVGSNHTQPQAGTDDSLLMCSPGTHQEQPAHIADGSMEPNGTDSCAGSLSQLRALINESLQRQYSPPTSFDQNFIGIHHSEATSQRSSPVIFSEQHPSNPQAYPTMDQSFRNGIEDELPEIFATSTVLTDSSSRTDLEYLDNVVSLFAKEAEQGVSPVEQSFGT